VLLPGNRYDTVGVAPLIKGLRFDALLADKAFDNNWIVAEMNERGAAVCIPQRSNRVTPRSFDMSLYKWRHLIENFFMKLKEFKRIALRAEKTDTSYSAMIYAVAALINSR
jgi:transposase